MLPMPDNMDYVKNFIALYCEKLFLTGHVENTDFLHNVVLYLFRKSLMKKTSVHFKRLYALRKILGVIMEECKPHTKELWSLFMECSLSNIYLENTEGQKVLGLIMAMDEVKLLEMHNKIKVYVPKCKIIQKAIGYGHVYFEAWCYTLKRNNERMRDTIELTCLQDYIKMGIERTENILPIIRKILNPYFIHKKQPEVCKLLYSIVQPIIWLYLKNPSGWHRAAAAQLFFDVFPLEDPDMRVVKNDQEVTEQMIMIQDLLKDDFPIVRITAVLGVCVSMSVNWEVFPEEMVKTIFRIIVNDLSRDSSNPEIRIAVIKGLRCLLENPLTTQCLVKVLPKLRGLFHDVDEEVRIAFCQLLLKVKTIYTIKYFDIVPPVHLFARMEEDCRTVQKCISHLLYNSYFPRHGDFNVWLGRCLEIIPEREAARVFFTYATNFVGVNQIVKFMVTAVRAVHFYIKTKSSSCHTDMELSDKENIQSFTDYLSDLETAVGFNNPQVVAGLMEAVIIMWISLKPDDQMEKGGKDYIKMLVKKTHQPLQELCLYYKNTVVWEPIFYLSSFISSAHMPGLSALCFVKLNNLPPDAKETDYMPLLECLMNHGQGVNLIKTLKDWIEVGLNNSYVVPPAKKRRGSKKRSEIIQQGPTKAHLANRMLDTILMYRNLQKRVILEKEALQEILDFMDIIKSKLETANPQRMSEEEADFLYLLVFNIIRFSIHLHDDGDSEKNILETVPVLDDLVEWVGKKLLKHITPIGDDPNHFTSLVSKICQSLAKAVADVTGIGFIEPNNCSYFEFMLSLLHTDFAHEYVLIVVRFFYKHAATSQYLILVNEDTVMLEHDLRYLNKMIVLLNNESLLEKVSDSELSEVTYTLASLMQIIHNHVDNYDLVSEIFNYILKCILKYGAVKGAELLQEMTEDPFDRLSFPLVGNFYWSIVSPKPKLIGTYVKLLAAIFKESENINTVADWIAFWMMLWGILHIKSISGPVLKTTFNLVMQLEKSLHRLYPITEESEPSNSEEPSKSDALQLFQSHCRTELIKIKKFAKSKSHAPPEEKKED